MNDFRNLRIEQHRPGVLTAVIDMPGRPVNVLDADVLHELEVLVTRLEHDRDLRMVVFRSAKEAGFLAGADVKQLQHLGNREEVDQVLRMGQELFDRIVSLPLMSVAVIHGACLGGGLEFALACEYRIARDDSSTRIGLPETQLGIIPGWGGTQRLPKRVGLETSLRMILEGQRLSAAKALSVGLVDAIAPPERFDATVKSFLTDRLAGKSLRRKRRRGLARLRDETRLGRWLMLRVVKRKLGRRARQYPALPAAMRAMQAGLRKGHARGLATEREEFSRVLFTPTCRHLLDLFFERERARRPATWASALPHDEHPIQRVAVIGAGTMGAGIAQLAALRGSKVVLKDIRQDIVDAGLQKVDVLMHDAVKAGAVSATEAEAFRKNVTGAVEWEPVANADIAIEAVIERLDVKQEVFRELDRLLPPHALLVSNTSALPISQIGGATSRPGQTAGLHFFNPVHRMQLVEVVRTQQTSDETIARLTEFVRDLGKVPVVVSESPGFLVNRILFPYLDEGVRLLAEGVPLETIDREAKRFGMPMGPLELLDQVGLDVAADVARTIAPFRTEDSPTTAILEAMKTEGRLGKKSNAGFYAYRHGRPHGAGHKPEFFAKFSPVAYGSAPQAGEVRVDASPSKAKRARLPDPAPLGGEVLSGIAQRLILPMINEAAECLANKVAVEAWMIDLAMVLGTGFAPFRGGPLRLADTWGLERVVGSLDRLTDLCGPRFRPSQLLRDMALEGRVFHHGHAEEEHHPEAGEALASVK